jgi:type II secretory ATPase GspE/PulE/Tfp pilus assembly ATPase PilB-like protein
MATEKAPTASQSLRIKSLENKLHQETSLRHLQNRVHTADLDEIMMQVKEDVRRLLEAERVTIYLKDPVKGDLVSRVKDGAEIKDIRIPISASSLAGFVAQSVTPLRLVNAYDPVELATIDIHLMFDKEWDKQTGFKTRQVLAVPVVKDGKLYGVMQALNSKKNEPFTDEQENLATEFAGALAIACSNKQRINIRASAYDMLIRTEVVAQDVFDRAQAAAQKDGVSVEHVLMTKHNIPITEIAKSFEAFYRTEFVPYKSDVLIPKDLLEGFALDYLKHHLAVPLCIENDKVVVLMTNPRNLTDKDELERRLSMNPTLKALNIRGTTIKVSSREHILDYIDLFFGLKVSEKDKEKEVKKIEIDKLVQQIEAKNKEPQKEKVPGEPEKAEDDASIIGLVNQIIVQAKDKGASDIHIEPYLEGDVLVRFRIDGNCLDYAKLPGTWGRALVSRIKIMSNLDIAERRLPQDGKIRFRDFGPLDIELRVATLPTAGGTEDIVMRILAASKPIPIDDMGMLPENLSRFKKVLQIPYGIVLCVGPTGSGKTTTLHSALGSIKGPDVKIWTAEDPVEIMQPGLRQVQVSSKIGFTFERAIRAFLRADPDIIMIGEMRDAETAGAAVEASLTGHLVFSTLHTNSAAETVTRLLDLGLDPYAFGDSLLAILAQRLCRRLCKECKVPHANAKDEFDKLRKEYNDNARFDELGLTPENSKLMQNKGCAKCNDTGYKGRVGLHELLVQDDDTRLMVYRKAKSMEIRDEAIKKGMILLKQDGIRKILQGITDLKEVLSVAAK